MVTTKRHDAKHQALIKPKSWEPVLSPASVAFVSSTKTQVLQVAQMWQDASVQCPGSWLLASLVGMQDPIQKNLKAMQP